MTFYNPQKVADILDVSYQTVLNYIKSGKLKALSLGNGYRVKESDLEEFIEENSN